MANPVHYGNADSASDASRPRGNGPALGQPSNLRSLTTHQGASVPNDRQFRVLKALAYLAFEVLLQTGRPAHAEVLGDVLPNVTVGLHPLRDGDVLRVVHLPRPTELGAVGAG